MPHSHAASSRVSGPTNNLVSTIPSRPRSPVAYCRKLLHGQSSSRSFWAGSAPAWKPWPKYAFKLSTSAMIHVSREVIIIWRRSSGTSLKRLLSLTMKMVLGGRAEGRTSGAAQWRLSRASTPEQAGRSEPAREPSFQATSRTCESPVPYGNLTVPPHSASTTPAPASNTRKANASNPA